MKVHLINPSDISFGTAVITPRWLYVLAGATPKECGDPDICDETLEQLDLSRVRSGDIVGIGIHTLNALRGYEVGRAVRERGAYVVFGGVHASLYPKEALELGGAHCVVRGDGDLVWSSVLRDLITGRPQTVYHGGRIEPQQFRFPRWDLLPRDRYLWASVQTLRGCPKHCSFCSVWRTDGQRPRQRAWDSVLNEIVELRRTGLRFILLADDNFYPVALTDLRLAEQQNNQKRLTELQTIRNERITLMSQLAQLPDDMVFFTQITMEAAEDPEFLDAMRKARIKGALVGVETVTSEGLRAVFKDFNSAGEQLVQRLHAFREYGVHVLGSFIFGLPTDTQGTFEATAKLAEEARIAFAQFVILMPLPGTVDFEHWEKTQAEAGATIRGIPRTRYWLIPPESRPKLLITHPSLAPDEIRTRTQGVWDSFYSLQSIWRRSDCCGSLRGRLAFLFISKLYRQMYAKTGLATDSARRNRARLLARCFAKACKYLFRGKGMPNLELPSRLPEEPGSSPFCSEGYKNNSIHVVD